MKNRGIEYLIVFAAFVVIVILMTACTPKEASTPVVTLPADVKTVQQARTVEQPADSPVPVVAAPAVVDKPVVVHSRKYSRFANSERAAYAKAYANARRANQLLGEHRYREHA